MFVSKDLIISLSFLLFLFHFWSNQQKNWIYLQKNSKKFENSKKSCPWLGKCVGKRSYKLFVYFIFSSFLLFSGIALLLVVEQLASLFLNTLKFVFLFPSDEYFLFGLLYVFKVSELDVITRLIMWIGHIAFWIPGFFFLTLFLEFFTVFLIILLEFFTIF